MSGRLQFLTCAAVLIMAACLPTAASAEEMTTTEAAMQPKAVLLQPASAWNVDFADEKCRIARFFEHEGKRHLLLIDQFVPESRFTLTVAGPRVRSLRLGETLDIGLVDNDPLRQKRFTKVDFDELGRAMMINTSLSAAKETERYSTLGFDLETAGQVERVVLRRDTKIVSFETGNLRDVAEVMNICTTGLLRSWGLDPEKHINYVGPEFLNIQPIAKQIQNAYPNSALRKRVEGYLRLRVIVETDGSVSTCKMAQVTQTEELEGVACKMMQDAKFKPASDASGEAMRSYYQTTIAYRLN